LGQGRDCFENGSDFEALGHLARVCASHGSGQRRSATSTQGQKRPGRAMKVLRLFFHSVARHKRRNFIIGQSRPQQVLFPFRRVTKGLRFTKPNFSFPAMNRNLSQTAKLLGAECEQVKNWSSLFKDCLSGCANPAKGQPRSFRDSDLFVLNYISSRWEAEPDIEAIKNDLSWDEHCDDQFQEKLYWHTPLLQEPPDELDETWRHGILLCGGGRYEYLELARNYKYVADSMLQSALEKDELSHWAYPILFSNRHTLELYLKIIGEIEEVTHSLKRCVHLVEKRHGGKKIRSPVREWIIELDQVDPAGTAFRYADGERSSNPYAEYWFDLRHFKFAMKQVFDEIDMAILRLGVTANPQQKT
jgi:hypothetical protein